MGWMATKIAESISSKRGFVAGWGIKGGLAGVYAAGQSCSSIRTVAPDVLDECFGMDGLRSKKLYTGVDSFVACTASPTLN